MKVKFVEVMPGHTADPEDGIDLAFETVGVGCSSVSREMGVAGFLRGEVLAIVRADDLQQLLAIADKHALVESTDAALEANKVATRRIAS